MSRIRELVPVGNGPGGSHKEKCSVELMPKLQWQDDTQNPIVEKEYNTARKQIGTLGGGR
jgi:hypothetical protein